MNVAAADRPYLVSQYSEKKENHNQQFYQNGLCLNIILGAYVNMYFNKKIQSENTQK